MKRRLNTFTDSPSNFQINVSNTGRADNKNQHGLNQTRFTMMIYIKTFLQKGILKIYLLTFCVIFDVFFV